MLETLQIVLIVASIPLLVFLIVYTVRHAQALNRRIEEYREEEEAAKSQPGPVNPYQQLADLYRSGSNGLHKNEQ
jgi:choline-glycine betaine transporter